MVLFMGPAFSMSSLMELSDPLGQSPFLVIDSKIAFMVSELKQVRSLYAKNIGALGVIAAHIFSGADITHTEDQKKIDSYVKEYLSAPFKKADGLYDEVLVFNESSIDPELWKNLKVGGFYLIGAKSVECNPPGKFEAFGKLWPTGESLEFGWKFDDEKTGLFDFEFYKIKKLE